MSSRSLHCLSADHRSASLHLLGRLTLGDESMPGYVERLSNTLRSLEATGEVVVLNTCNRFEVYWSEGSPAAIYAALDEKTDEDADAHGDTSEVERKLRSLIASTAGIAEEELAPALTSYAGHRAIDHLFRVSSGLESLVVGEHQILGQVEQAFSASGPAGGSGPIMGTLQNAALRCGRRARSESDIGKNPRDVSTVAVQLSERLLGRLDQRRVLVAGAGEMGRLVAKSLSHRKVERIDVVNRTLETAREATRRWGGEAHGMEEMGALLKDADVVFATTSSPVPILTEAIVGEAMNGRPGRQMVLVDLAVPRNIDPAVSGVEGVHLFDLDGLNEMARAGEAERRLAVPKVEAIIGEEAANFRRELGGLAVRPVLAELWSGAEETRRSILLETRSRLDGLSDEQWSEIESMTRLLTKKLLHVPSARLRSETSNGFLARYADLVSHLFGLSNELSEG